MKGLCGKTYSHQPISQAVLELELEVRNGGTRRAMLTDGFVLRVFFNTQNDEVSTHYMSTRVYEPEDYIAHLLFAFASSSNEDLAESNFELVAADIDDADADVVIEGEIEESSNLKVGRQGSSAAEGKAVAGGGAQCGGPSTGSKSVGRSSAVNENIYISNGRRTINLNFQDKLDDYYDKVDRLKEADNRRLGLFVLTESELERRAQQRPIDSWMLDGIDAGSDWRTQSCGSKLIKNCN